LNEGRVELEIAPGTVITVARQVVVRRADELPDGSATDVETDPNRSED
jgi:preprotein translocase subunit YajC